MSRWFHESLTQWIDDSVKQCTNEFMLERFSEPMSQWINESVVPWMTEVVRRWSNEPLIIQWKPWTDESMHGWTCEPMSESVTEWMSESMDQRISVPGPMIQWILNQWINEPMNQWISKSMNPRTINQWTSMSEGMDVWMDGWSPPRAWSGCFALIFVFLNSPRHRCWKMHCVASGILRPRHSLIELPEEKSETGTGSVLGQPENITGIEYIDWYRS